MNLYKNIIANEVYPAIGCTEPISCAYAATLAAKHLPLAMEQLILKVDPGTYKNGATVSIPHSQGAKGNVIAALLGALVKNPDKQLRVLEGVTPTIIKMAKEFNSKRIEYTCLDKERDFRIEVEVRAGDHYARCILARSHTNIEILECDGKILVQEDPKKEDSSPLAYRNVLKKTPLRDLLLNVETLNPEDLSYLQKGIEMNLALTEKGESIHLFAHELKTMQKKGYIAEDLFYKAKRRIAAAVDARMAGVELPTMTSGGSGNQGIVTILTTHIVGAELGVEQSKILKSIAIAHMVNAYTKCFLGELSVICGCAMSAGVAAATAIVYQQQGLDMDKITLAIHNVIGDLSGLICDGAKPGCALKATSAVDCALRGAFMAIENYGINNQDGVLGKTVEESIQHLRQITLEGMCQVDPTLLAILKTKAKQ